MATKVRKWQKVDSSSYELKAEHRHPDVRVFVDEISTWGNAGKWQVRMYHPQTGESLVMTNERGVPKRLSLERAKQHGVVVARREDWLCHVGVDLNKPEEEKGT